MKSQEKTMRLKICSFLQSFSLILICLGVFGLVSYHRQETNDEASSGDKAFGEGLLSLDQPRWQERAPRSLTNRDYDHNFIEEDTDKKSSKDDELEELKQRVLSKTMATYTATPKPATALHDIFISVKTTKKFHNTRLEIILKTWFNLAKEQTWFFSDTDDAEVQKRTGNHLVNTNCSSSHNRKALCCKMSREFDAFLESNKRWWCHFDDDNYVNVPALVSTLESYDPLRDWYLGRPSIRAPLEILNKDDLSQKISFWFATGGAGFCLSRSLALKMMPIAGGGKFISVGEKIRLPDDVTMGYIIEHVLRKKLTIVEEFHSHLEPMRFVNTDSISNQISFGYSHYGSEMNVVSVEGLPEKVDPTRMYSLHCKLFPTSLYCPR